MQLRAQPGKVEDAEVGTMRPCCAISFDESTLGRLGSSCAQREQGQDDVADDSARVADNERTGTRGGRERWTEQTAQLSRTQQCGRRAA